MSDLTSLLAEHPFFAGLEREQLERVAEGARSVTVDAGDYIVRTGQPATEFYVLHHGRVAVEIHAGNRGPLVVQTLDAQDVLGWSWITQPPTWRFDARALELTRALVFDAEWLRDLMEKEADVGQHLMRQLVQVMTERLEAARLQLVDFYAAETSPGGAR